MFSSPGRAPTSFFYHFDMGSTQWPCQTSRGCESVESWSGSPRETEGFFPARQEAVMTTRQVKTTHFTSLNWSIYDVWLLLPGCLLVGRACVETPTHSSTVNTFQAQQANFPTGPATFQAGPPTFPSAPTFPPAPNHHQATPGRRRTRRSPRRSPPPAPAETRSRRCALLLIIYVMTDLNFKAGFAEN